MSKHKTSIFSIVRIILNGLFIAFYFVPFLYTAAQYPTVDGKVFKEVYFFSIYHNIVVQNAPFSVLFWIALSITAISLVSSILSIIFSKNSKIKNIANILLLISFILFIVMSFIGLACSPCY